MRDPGVLPYGSHGNFTSMLPFARLLDYGSTMHFSLTPANERVVGCLWCDVISNDCCDGTK